VFIFLANSEKSEDGAQRSDSYGERQYQLFNKAICSTKRAPAAKV
jgi:hypothetical protein